MKPSHRLKAQTSRIVSSFKAPSISCSLSRQFRGHRDGVWDVTTSKTFPLIGSASAGWLKLPMFKLKLQTWLYKDSHFDGRTIFLFKMEQLVFGVWSQDGAFFNIKGIKAQSILWGFILLKILLWQHQETKPVTYGKLLSHLSKW